MRWLKDSNCLKQALLKHWWLKLNYMRSFIPLDSSYFTQYLILIFSYKVWTILANMQPLQINYFITLTHLVLSILFSVAPIDKTLYVSSLTQMWNVSIRCKTEYLEHNIPFDKSKNHFVSSAGSWGSGKRGTATILCTLLHLTWED